MKESSSWLCRGLLGGLLLARLTMGQDDTPAPGDGGDTNNNNNDLCLLCLDGSTPLETEELLEEGRFGPDVSCASLLEGAQDLLVESCNSEDFFVLQLTLIQANCCPSNDSSTGSPACTLCPDGSSEIAFPSRTLPAPSDDSSLVDISCGDLVQNETVPMEFLEEFVGEPGVCENTLLRRAAGYCGCPTVPPGCDLCNNGELLLSDEEFGLTNTSCSEIAFQVSLLPEGQCQQQATNSSLFGFDTAALCCENVERPNQCNLCTAQEQLVPVRAVTTGAYGEVTCAELQDAATLVNLDAACESLKEEADGACCVQRPEGAICELTCPDGSTPPDPSKRDPVTGHSCEDLSLEYAKFSAGEEDGGCDNAAISSAIGFDAVAFCCPRVDPPNECFLCPPGEELLYPERVLFGFNEGEHSCSDLNASLRHVVGATNCQSILDDSLAERNCQCRMARPPAPTQAPNAGAPTPGGGGGGDSSGTIRRHPGTRQSVKAMGAAFVVAIYFSSMLP